MNDQDQFSISPDPVALTHKEARSNNLIHTLFGVAFILSAVACIYWLYNITSVNSDIKTRYELQGLALFSLALIYGFFINRRGDDRKRLLLLSFFMYLFFTVATDIFTFFEFSSTTSMVYVIAYAVELVSACVLFIMLALKIFGKSYIRILAEVLCFVLIVTPLPSAIKLISKNLDYLFTFEDINYFAPFLYALIVYVVQVVFCLLLFRSFHNNFFYMQYIEQCPPDWGKEIKKEKKIPKKVDETAEVETATDIQAEEAVPEKSPATQSEEAAETSPVLSSEEPEAEAAPNIASNASPVGNNKTAVSMEVLLDSIGSVRKMYGFARFSFVVGIIACLLQTYFIADAVSISNNALFQILQGIKSISLLAIVLGIAFTLFIRSRRRVWYITGAVLAYIAASLVSDFMTVYNYSLTSIDTLSDVVEIFGLLLLAIFFIMRAVGWTFPKLLLKVTTLVLALAYLPYVVIVISNYVGYIVQYSTNLSAVIQFSVFILQHVTICLVVFFTYLMAYMNTDDGFFVCFMTLHPRQVIPGKPKKAKKVKPPKEKKAKKGEPETAQGIIDETLREENAAPDENIETPDKNTPSQPEQPDKAE